MNKLVSKTLVTIIILVAGSYFALKQNVTCKSNYFDGVDGQLVEVVTGYTRGRCINYSMGLGFIASYEIVGWDEQDILYYSKIDDGKITHFSYRLSDSKPKLIENLPDNLTQISISGGLLNKIDFRGSSQSIGSLYIVPMSGFISPTGSYLAFVERNYEAQGKFHVVVAEN